MFRLLFIMSNYYSNRFIFEYYHHLESDTYHLKITNMSTRKSYITLCKSIEQLAHVSDEKAQYYQKKGYTRPVEQMNYKMILNNLKLDVKKHLIKH